MEKLVITYLYNNGYMFNENIIKKIPFHIIIVALIYIKRTDNSEKFIPPSKLYTAIMLSSKYQHDIYDDTTSFWSDFFICDLDSFVRKERRFLKKLDYKLTFSIDEFYNEVFKFAHEMSCKLPIYKKIPKNEFKNTEIC